MDSPVIFDRLAESTTPHIEKTHSLGVEVATTESHLQETTAIFGYCSLFLLHHSNRFKFSVAQELSMSTRYDFSCFCSRKSFTISGCTFLYVVQHPLYSSCYGLGIRLAFSAINTHRIF